MNIEQEFVSSATNASQSVSYAKGSVVSRQIMKGEGGTVTLFAFDRGQSLSSHTSPYDAFVQMIDGKAEFVIGTKQVVVGAGECIILPSNVPHAVHAVEQFKMLLAMIKG